MELKNCHDCGVKPGKPHQTGCDVERCSVCGSQKVQCDCKDHVPLLAKWTGVWPGTENNVCKNTFERITILKFITEKYQADGKNATELNDCYIKVIKQAIDDLKILKQYKAGIRSLRKEYIRKSNSEGILGIVKTMYLSFAKELGAFEDIK